MNIFNKEEQKPESNFMYTEEQLMARLKFFIGICLALTLFGIVFVVLYSLIFVTQPLNAISPIDQKFFELIIPIATFLTGTLSGIMLAGGDKDAQKMALQAATRPTTVSPSPTPSVITRQVKLSPASVSSITEERKDKNKQRKPRQKPPRRRKRRSGRRWSEDEF